MDKFSQLVFVDQSYSKFHFADNLNNLKNNCSFNKQKNNILFKVAIAGYMNIETNIIKIREVTFSKLFHRSEKKQNGVNVIISFTFQKILNPFCLHSKRYYYIPKDIKFFPEDIRAKKSSTS